MRRPATAALVSLVVLLPSACVGKAEETRKPPRRERAAVTRDDKALPPPAAGPKGVRIVAEAEDFTIESGPWSVLPYPRNYFASTFAITFLSRMACLSAPAQGSDAAASQRLVVPEAGNYRVFARYEAPYNFSAEFTLEIEQGGRSILRQVYGRLGDVKIWGFAEPRRVAMPRFWWGASEHIAWQEAGPVRLERGEATLRLRAGAQLDGAGPRAAAAERHVDAIVLTNDTAGLEAQKKTDYLEMDGWLVQDGDLFVRFTNPTDGLGPVVPIVEPFGGGQHSPFAVHVRDWPTTRVLRSGRLSDASYVLAGPHSSSVAAASLAPLLDPARFATLPDEEFLAPGETSGWVPLGGAVDALNDSQWFPKALALNGGKKEKRVDLEVEFGVPDGRGGVRPLRKLRVQGTPGYLSPTTFVIPGNVRARPVIRTELEALQWLNAEVAKFPARGSVPKRFPIYGILGFSNALGAEGPIADEARKLAVALGDNTATRDAPGLKIATHWRLPQVEKGYADAEKKGTLASIGIVSYGDEIKIEPGKDAAPDAATFTSWLRGKSVADAAETRYSDDPTAPGYYYSRLFGFERQMDAYAKATQWLESRMGKSVRTGINYAPHANYMVDDLHWVRPFKNGALTLPWSEDYVWQIPEFSPQVTGYLVSGLRAGAKYHDLPILMYVMPHSPGNVPRDFRLSFYAAIAHGATKIHYFSASPLAVGNTENYVATEDLGMWRAIHDTSHDAGVFEDYVLGSHVRPARVGLLLSSVDEIRSGDSNSQGGVHNQERKALYYALRHAQVPVDFVTEDDVLEGRAKDVAVLYVTQQFLHSRAVAALTKWVEAGGTLVALCGGGFLDESGRDNPAAHALYGVDRQSLSKDPGLPMILAKQDLPPAKALDEARWGAVKAPVIAWKQALTASDGKVVGTFGDGKPAVVERARGRGRAVLFGFLPGIAYLKSGLPLRPVDRSGSIDGYDHFLPTAMDTGLRGALVDAFLPAGFMRPVETSEPLVEATLLETPGQKRLAIPLMNWSGRPQAALKLRLAGVGLPRAVRSVERGALKGSVVSGGFELTLPLDVADMLLVDLQ